MTDLVAASALVSSAVSARRHDVSECEEALFRRCNHAPDRIEAPAWLLMQTGTLGSVIVAGAAVARTESARRSAGVLAVGSAVWIGMKLLKPVVGRGRPDELLDDVIVRGRPQTGLGYPSGHAAVATVLALVAPVPRPARWGLLGLAGLAGAGRVYVGAHLPLDVVGGLAAGTLAAAVSRTAISREGPGS